MPFPASLDERVIYLNSMIDDDTARLTMQALLLFDRHQPGAPITLIISSSGGVVYAGLAIYDVMRSLRSPLYTIAEGMVAGVAVLLLAAGHKDQRYLTPPSFITMTKIEVKDTTPGGVISREVNRLRNVIGTCYADCTGVRDASEFVPEEDRHLSHEEVLRLGIADHVMDQASFDDWKGPWD